MKKYNLKKIMMRAWSLKRSNSRNLFSSCLEMAWSEAKSSEFENNMIVEADGFHRRLTRWTKYGNDRVYINHDFSKKDDGYVDLKTGEFHLRGNIRFQVLIAERIIGMSFPEVENESRSNQGYAC